MTNLIEPVNLGVQFFHYLRQSTLQRNFDILKLQVPFRKLNKIYGILETGLATVISDRIWLSHYCGSKKKKCNNDQVNKKLA